MKKVLQNFMVFFKNEQCINLVLGTWALIA